MSEKPEIHSVIFPEEYSKHLSNYTGSLSAPLEVYYGAHRKLSQTLFFWMI